MPIKPNTWDANVTAAITPIGVKPVAEPWMYGAIMLPSICWRTSTIAAKIITLIGSPVEIRISNADGIAPINGPKKGITFVKPQVTAIKIAKSKLKTPLRKMRLHLV